MRHDFRRVRAFEGRITLIDTDVLYRGLTTAGAANAFQTPRHIRKNYPAPRAPNIAPPELPSSIHLCPTPSCSLLSAILHL